MAARVNLRTRMRDMDEFKMKPSSSSKHKFIAVSSLRQFGPKYSNASGSVEITMVVTQAIDDINSAASYIVKGKYLSIVPCRDKKIYIVENLCGASNSTREPSNVSFPGPESFRRKIEHRRYIGAQI